MYTRPYSSGVVEVMVKFDPMATVGRGASVVVLLTVVRGHEQCSCGV